MRAVIAEGRVSFDRWHTALPAIIEGYNNTQHTVTKVPPYVALRGRFNRAFVGNATFELDKSWKLSLKAMEHIHEEMKLRVIQAGLRRNRSELATGKVKAPYPPGTQVMVAAPKTKHRQPGASKLFHYVHLGVVKASSASDPYSYHLTWEVPPVSEKAGKTSAFKYHHSELKPTPHRISAVEFKGTKDLPPVAASRILAWNGNATSPQYLVAFDELPLSAANWVTEERLGDGLTGLERAKLQVLRTVPEIAVFFNRLKHLEKYEAPVQTGRGDRMGAASAKRFHRMLEE